MCLGGKQTLKRHSPRRHKEHRGSTENPLGQMNNIQIETPNDVLESGQPLNYFSYFTEIEDAFVRRRGKHLFVSPQDWALIEAWKEIGIPLHVALRSIEKVFDSWESKPQKRSIKSLLYCQEEVEAQFAEWRESRVGATDVGGATKDGGANEASESEGLPFSRAAILNHLCQGQATLSKVYDNRMEAGSDDFSETLNRAVVLLADLERDVETAFSFDAQKLEQSLSGLERMLSDALRLVVSSKQLETVKSEVKDQLKSYRKHMEPAVYQQTFDNLLLKRLREQFGIPRLSLFYL